jgi:putative ABC transport system permease protein
MLHVILNQIFSTRNLLKKDLFHTGLNLVGLTVGLFATLVIALVLRYEYSFDQWIDDHQHVYIVGANKNVPSRPTRQIQSAPAALMPFFKQGLSELKIGAMNFPGVLKVVNGADHYFVSTAFVDATFLDVFPVNVINGSLQAFGESLDGIVLTKTESLRLFGRSDSVKQILQLASGRSVVVKAVIEDWPSNSHVKITSLLPLRSPEFEQREAYLTNWGSTGGTIYLKFKQTIDVKLLKSEINGILAKSAPRHYGQEQGGLPPFYQLKLTNITQVGTGGGNERTLLGLSMTSFGLLLMGIVILLIAAINFAISASAQVANRHKEIAIRKILGANKNQLGMQFIVEASIFCLLAYLISLVLLLAFLPFIEQSLQRELSLVIDDPLFYLGGVGITLLIGVLSGLYPSYLAIGENINISEVTTKAKSKLLVLKAFVFAQIFCASMLLFITIVIIKQLLYIGEIDKGFDTKNVELITLNHTAGNIAAFKQAVTRIDSVALTGLVNTYPASGETHSSSVKSDNINSIQNAQWINADEGALEALSVKLLHGRLFSPSRPVDNVKTNTQGAISVVVTQSTIRMLGYNEPQQAVGQRFELIYGSKKGWREALIIGVVGDLKTYSVLQEAPPLIVIKDSDKFNYIVTKIKAGQSAIAKAAIVQLHQRYFNNQTAVLKSLDQHFFTLFNDERKQGKLTAVAAIVAVILTCIGILALSTLLLNRDVKAMVIRKILGASDKMLVSYVLSHFYIPFIVGCLVSLPLASWLADLWLQSFVYQVSLSPLVYLLPMLIVLGVVLVVGVKHYITIKRLAPADVLHYQ